MSGPEVAIMRVSNDFVLLRYLRSLFRGLQLRRRDASLSADRPSLLCLPDDILLLILDELYVSSHTPCGIWNNRELSGLGFTNLSKTNRRLRSLAAPKLFRTVNLGPSWSAEKTGGALTSMWACKDVLQYTRKLRIDLWLGGSANEVEELVLAKRLAALIPRLGRLKTLAVTMTEDRAMILKAAFEEYDVLLPQIDELVLSPHLQWIVAMCPRIRSISTNDWMLICHNREHDRAFVEAAAKVQDLQHFSLHSRWRQSLLEQVSRMMPQLRSLGMPGAEVNYWARPDDLFRLLDRFQQLESLELVGAQRLAAGLFSGSSSFKSYPFEPREYSYGMTRDQELVTKYVFKRMPHLKELVLGRWFKARVVRSSTHSMDVRWEVTVHSNDMAQRIYELVYPCSCPPSRQLDADALVTADS